MLVPMLASMLPLLLAGLCSAQEEPLQHPVSHDRTGIEWQIPFSLALDKAAAEKRLLAIKPVAFGTTSNGCW